VPTKRQVEVWVDCINENIRYINYQIKYQMIDYLTALVSESIAREIVKDLLKEYFRKPLICIKLLSYFSRVLYQD